MSEATEWKSPAEVLKRRIVKRRSAKSSRESSGSQPSPNILTQTSNVNTTTPTARKRSNPFASQRTELDNKSPKIAPEIDEGSQSNLLQCLQQYSKQSIKGNRSTDDPRQELFPSKNSVPNILQSLKKQDRSSALPIFPFDWSLKTKLRFMSDQPFSCAQSQKAEEICQGLVKFTSFHVNKTETITESVKIELQSLSHYWIHPSLPWVNLYPRTTTSKKDTASLLSFNDEKIKVALHTDWMASMVSLFDQLQFGHCPYFYVCIHWATVLFRAATDTTEMNAVLTPSTVGLREVLQSEGVEFELLTKSKPSSAKEDLDLDSSIGENKENVFHEKDEDKTGKENDEGECSDEEEEPTNVNEWLQTLGINTKNNIITIQANKPATQANYQVIDGRQESAIYFRGSDTVCLFNYLLNCRNLVQPTGPLAGIPPTLLAPHSFKGATLRSLKLKTTSLGSAGGLSASHVLEVAGPVLPSTVSRMCELLSKTQNNFTLHAVVQDDTAPFNIQPDLGTSKKDYDELVEQFKGQTGSVHIPIEAETHCRLAMRDLKCNNQMFSW